MESGMEGKGKNRDTLPQASHKEKRERNYNRWRSGQRIEVTKMAKPNTDIQIVLEQDFSDPPSSDILFKTNVEDREQFNATLYSHIVSRGDDRFTAESWRVDRAYFLPTPTTGTG
ncbi:uncharacterized [Tachysurus ichikawai]